MKEGAKVIHVATVDMSIRYMLLSQMQYLRDAGYEVAGASADGPDADIVRKEGFPVYPVPFTRRISPLSDFRSLVTLYRLFRERAPDIVHTHTPKAGLIGQVAAWLAAVPVRINTVHGFYFHERTPWLRRRFYIALERLTSFCATRVLSQSSEDVATANREGICHSSKIAVLGNGVDVSRYDPKRVTPAAIENLRREFGIPVDCPVVGFVGRLVKEKGILEYLEAAIILSRSHPDTRFLLVGPCDNEKADAVDPTLLASFGLGDRCIVTGRRADMPVVYALMDINVLPSHREGFPRTPMEASLMETPSIVTDIRGCREAIRHGRNGLVVPAQDSPALANAIANLLDDAERRKEMGKEGRRIGIEYFDERRVNRVVVAEYAAQVNSDVRTHTEAASLSESDDARAAVDVLPFPPNLGDTGSAYPGKRILDLSIVALALPLLISLGGLCSLLVYLSMGRPILFRQRRPGLYGRPFEILKFRTMTSATDKDGRLLPDSDRITVVGKFLRRFSLDELPEIINVLRGEMSLVGPRPLLFRYMPHFYPYERDRFKVLPGISGWAQVNGRNRLNWDNRLQCDVWYVRHATLRLDVRILLLTCFQSVMFRNVVISPTTALRDLDDLRA